jgi:hypothetical protein
MDTIGFIFFFYWMGMGMDWCWNEEMISLIKKMPLNVINMQKIANSMVWVRIAPFILIGSCCIFWTCYVFCMMGMGHTRE